MKSQELYGSSGMGDILRGLCDVQGAADADVSVWCTDTDACIREADLSRYSALMSPSEVMRNQRFFFERDRLTDLVARALVRTVLGRWLGIRPETICFEAGPRGKPELARDVHRGPRPFFNLTHSQGMVMLAVSNDRPVGIDVECTDRKAPLELASRYFMASEARALFELPADMRANRFWALWTLKESLIKACGEGLHVPMDGFGFGFEGEGLLSLSLASHIEKLSLRKSWWFGQWRASARHMAALCVDALGGPPASVRVYVTVPLVREQSEVPSFIRTSCPGRLSSPGWL